MPPLLFILRFDQRTHALTKDNKRSIKIGDEIKMRNCVLANTLYVNKIENSNDTWKKSAVLIFSWKRHYNNHSIIIVQWMSVSIYSQGNVSKIIFCLQVFQNSIGLSHLWTVFLYGRITKETRTFGFYQVLLFYSNLTIILRLKLFSESKSLWNCLWHVLKRTSMAKDFE